MLAAVVVQYFVSLDEALCSACRACLPSCKHGGMLHVPGERIPMVDPWSCTGCGTCISVCPEDALRLTLRGTR
ncbi:MAG: 4Fe-4S dicluster domain-containing protein [Anaerolineales bacterium]|nr:MAG: 4Fe-4S dicluster domain-containing protein [Anaerolineales bacterium]